MLSEMSFLKDLMYFSEVEKDNINDETCELLEPYLNLTDHFTPAVAKAASGAVEGLCIWVGAMKE